ncbi:Nodal modulator 1 [Papilio machaon]|uniref:Nodal modulator 1 n=1 Tax=Papilio machaon TaxID=76193 RepID=A0A0N1IF28_PAPMA|nr:Nodal modulator 1 [Papilio machaon]
MDDKKKVSTVQVEYKSKSARGVLSVPAGASEQCVPAAEQYTLTPRGCHLFQPPVARVDLAADDPPTVEFSAVSHAAVVRVTSPDPVSDLMLHVEAAEGGRDLGPLTPVPDPAGGYVFEHTLYLADGEEVSVRATSATLLVRPREAQRVRGAAGCGAPALQLRAARGLTLAGRLLPPVADVLITLRSDDLVLTQVTGEDGTYRFGPLERGRRYVVNAQKDSYVFGERDEDGNIAASKLAEILVELQDEADGKPLEGALVSVSGGEYRRTAASDAEGRLRFVSLAPAQYYVRPHLKEYLLRPPHATLHVPPHTDHVPHDNMRHTLRFTGVRVAWSVWGSVVSLNGAGVAGVGVRALPVSPSAEAPPPPPPRPHTACRRTPPPRLTPHSGTALLNLFFIRGLMPNCHYKLELKESSAPELSGLRLAKAPPLIEMKEQDVENVRLIVIQRAAVTDGGVVVRALADHMRTLRLTLSAQATPHAPPLMAARPDAPPPSGTPRPHAALLPLPRLPADNATYVLRLDSTLSKTTHDYDDVIIHFVSDGRFKDFTIEFMPKVRTSEQELRATSILIVPVLCLLALAVSQRQRLLQLLTAASASAASAASAHTGKRALRKKVQ